MLARNAAERARWATPSTARSTTTRKLRAELKALGHKFRTDHSDTEVLLHAYREWGDAFVGRLNGMWAFVIHDRGRRRLFGSRDRFGKKPMYWFHERGTFAWASKLPALREHPDCPRSLDALSLRKYFAYCYIPAPRSIYVVERSFRGRDSGRGSCTNL